MRREFVGCLLFLLAAPAGWSQTFLAGQQAQMDKVRAMNQDEVGKLLNSEPPAFCTIVPAISATILVGDNDFWNWGKMPVEKRIQFEQAYAAGLRKLQVCLYDSIQKNDDQVTQSSVFALALLEARYLDLRASLMLDAVTRIEQLSGAVNQMQNLFLVMNQSQKGQKPNRFGQALGAALQGLGNWAQYQQQLNLYRAYSAQSPATYQRQPALDVFGMMRRAQEDIRNAAHPLGYPLNCTTTTSLDGSMHTVCH